MGEGLRYLLDWQWCLGHLRGCGHVRGKAMSWAVDHTGISAASPSGGNQLLHQEATNCSISKTMQHPSTAALTQRLPLHAHCPRTLAASQQAPGAGWEAGAGWASAAAATGALAPP